MVPDELRTAEQQVELLEQAMAFSSCGITPADARLPDLPFIYVNGAFEQMTGYPAEDVLGKKLPLPPRRGARQGSHRGDPRGFREPED